MVEPVEPRIRELLRACPTMPATVAAERIRLPYSIRTLSTQVIQLRMAYLACGLAAWSSSTRAAIWWLPCNPNRPCPGTTARRLGRSPRCWTLTKPYVLSRAKASIH